jgi:hypothetical protein
VHNFETIQTVRRVRKQFENPSPEKSSKFNKGRAFSGSNNKNQMNKTITFLIVFFFSCAVGAYSQNTPRPGIVKGGGQAILFDSARFEMFPAEMSVVRLDRFTGKTHYYEPQRRRWYLLEVRGGLPNEAGNVTPKYQINTEGGSPILFNNETGQSWFLEMRIWYPIPD